MMKKLIIAALMLAALPQLSLAQVEKQVEVTKAYTPSLERPNKLDIVPDMTDTVKMNPDIDYTITPLSISTSLQTTPIKPATVTYWEFNRPLPLYIKAGAGYPLNSVFDLYASTQNKGTGYVVGYINHLGRYADIRNNFDEKHNSVEMYNRAGAAAGIYVGRHLFEGGVNYDNRMFHRYGMSAGRMMLPDDAVYGSLVDYSNADFSLRFGDEFVDLSRWNFEVKVDGSLFFDHSERSNYSPKGRETRLGASAKVARAFGRRGFSLSAACSGISGHKAVSDYFHNQVSAGARFFSDGRFFDFEVGCDFYHDIIRGADNENYFIPYLRGDLNLGTKSLRPFVEIDGGVYDNGFAALSRVNPYVASGSWLGKSSVDYNGRFGLHGVFGRSKMSYRVYAGFSVHDNNVYWLLYHTGAFVPLQARQTETSFNGEIEYRPLSALVFNLGVHGYIYNDDALFFSVDSARPEGDEAPQQRVRFAPENGKPSFRGELGAKYEGRKISFGVKALFESRTKWSVETVSHSIETDGYESSVGVEKCSAFVNLGVDFEWQISSRVSFFAEGRNLLNKRIYRFAGYPEYGANFTAGVKLNF